ncbi:MAG: hypothetical protein RBQ99_06540 [Trichlorobacter sp.]|nr:hypothetical protein [Trichlorobacter sp.]
MKKPSAYVADTGFAISDFLLENSKSHPYNRMAFAVTACNTTWKVSAHCLQ